MEAQTREETNKNKNEKTKNTEQKSKMEEKQLDGCTVPHWHKRWSALNSRGKSTERDKNRPDWKVHPAASLFLYIYIYICWFVLSVLVTPEIDLSFPFQRKKGRIEIGRKKSECRWSSAVLAPWNSRGSAAAFECFAGWDTTSTIRYRKINSVLQKEKEKINQKYYQMELRYITATFSFSNE